MKINNPTIPKFPFYIYNKEEYIRIINLLNNGGYKQIGNNQEIYINNYEFTKICLYLTLFPNKKIGITIHMNL